MNQVPGTLGVSAQVTPRAGILLPKDSILWGTIPPKLRKVFLSGLVD